MAGDWLDLKRDNLKGGETIGHGEDLQKHNLSDSPQGRMEKGYTSVGAKTNETKLFRQEVRERGLVCNLGLVHFSTLLLLLKSIFLFSSTPKLSI